MSRTYVFAKRGASTSQTSYEIRGSDLRLLKSPSVGSTGKRSSGPFSYTVSPRLALLFMPKNRDFPLFKSGTLWVTGYKTLWSEAWCISRWYIVPQTIFAQMDVQKKRTGKSALIVKRQNPASYLGGKGLFKKQKICKKSTEHYTVQAYF